MLWVQVLDFYKCENLTSPTYNVSFLNQTVNPKPYCAELFNPQKLPYAFHFFPMEAKDDGFPVYFDINLSQEGAQVAWPSLCCVSRFVLPGGGEREGTGVAFGFFPCLSCSYVCACAWPRLSSSRSVRAMFLMGVCCALRWVVLRDE